MIKFKPLTTQKEWEWVSKRAKPIQVADSQGLVAYNEDTNVICGIVVMDNWTISGCHAHIAIDNPMCIRAGLLSEAFFHIHVTCNRKYAFGAIPASNKKAYNFDLKIGFEEVARIPDGFAEGEDYIIIRMSRENNPWLFKQMKQKEAA
tara:strand:+ start:129 stop:572 length:444 start_codon:yes stop_codon:yes gene_type:complete